MQEYAEVFYTCKNTHVQECTNICNNILEYTNIYKDILEYTVHTYDIHVCSVAHINPSSGHGTCIMCRIIDIINNEDLRYWSM